MHRRDEIDGWFLAGPEDEPFITVAECARRLGISRAALYRQVQGYAVRSYENIEGAIRVRRGRGRSPAQPRSGASQPPPSRAQRASRQRAVSFRTSNPINWTD